MAERAREGEITIPVAAEHLGMTTQAVGLWAARPGSPTRRTKSGIFLKWPDFARWREAELVATARKGAENSTIAQRIQEAQARSEEARAEMVELELERERGSMIALSDTEAVIAKILDRLMASLRSLPLRMPELSPETLLVVETAVERLVVELNAFDEDMLDEPTDDVPQERAA